MAFGLTLTLLRGTKFTKLSLNLPTSSPKSDTARSDKLNPKKHGHRTSKNTTEKPANSSTPKSPVQTVLSSPRAEPASSTTALGTTVLASKPRRPALKRSVEQEVAQLFTDDANFYACQASKSSTTNLPTQRPNQNSITRTKEPYLGYPPSPTSAILSSQHLAKPTRKLRSCIVYQAMEEPGESSYSFMPLRGWKKWRCCQCDCETHWENGVCSNLECMHKRCEDECLILPAGGREYRSCVR